MIISEMPQQEDPEQYDSITILLRFRQVQVVQPSTPALREPKLCSRRADSAPTQNTGLLTLTQSPAWMGQRP